MIANQEIISSQAEGNAQYTTEHTTTLLSILTSTGIDCSQIVIQETINTSVRSVSIIYKNPTHSGEQYKKVGVLTKINVDRVFPSETIATESNQDALAEISAFFNKALPNLTTQVNRDMRQVQKFSPLSLERVWIEEGYLCILQFENVPRTEAKPLVDTWTTRKIAGEITAGELRKVVSTLSTLMQSMTDHDLLHSRLDPSNIHLYTTFNYLKVPSVSLFLSRIFFLRNKQLTEKGLARFSKAPQEQDKAAIIWSSPELLTTKNALSIDIKAHNQFITAQLIYWLICGQLPYMPDTSIKDFFPFEAFTDQTVSVSLLMSLSPHELLRMRRQMVKEHYPTAMPLSLLYYGLSQNNERLRRVLERLDAVFSQALHIDPAQRFPSIVDMQTQLLAVLDSISDADLNLLQKTEPTSPDHALLRGSIAETIPTSAHTDDTAPSPQSNNATLVRRMIARFRKL